MPVATTPRALAFFAVLALTGLVSGCAGSGDNGPATEAVTRIATDTAWGYPASATVGQVDDYHGTRVADPYRWLEDVDSEQTKAWVEAQNKITFGFLESIPARERFRQRLTDLWDYPKYGTPFLEGERLFFFKNDGLQPQSVLYVQEGATGEPRVLLDPNTLSADGTVSLGDTRVSEDGQWLAWSFSESGSDWRTWKVRNIGTGEDLADRIQWSKFSGASWAKDGSGFYYSRYDAPTADDAYEETNYYQKVFFHRVGTPQSEDVLVYERPDQKEWGFDAGVSEDGRFLVIHAWQGSHQNNRLFYLDLRQPGAQVVEFLSDFDASYDFIGNDGSVFYIQTNLDAPNGKIIAIDTARPDRAGWRTLIGESADALRGATMLNDSFVLHYLHDVASRIRIHDRRGNFLNELELPGLGSVRGLAGHRDDTETYYLFTSFLNPTQIYHYDFDTGLSRLYRSPEIDFDFSDYQLEQVFFESRDGTRVPMFIIHRKGLKRDGTHPTILYGYGGFNVTLTPRFSIGLLPWLESGGIYASANLRGGGEYGEMWHQAGMLDQKQNTFDDFISAAEFLFAEGFTSPAKLAIDGASNGGLLVGAVLNQRPELFGAAIPAVGVMDMLRFHLFTIGWAWVSDYGSSEDPDMFDVLYSYSPYHNIHPGTEYPPVLITTADHDDRVVPGHSFKYAARLQAAQAGPAPILIRIQTKSGHGGGKPTAMRIQEYADRYAFLTRVLRMDAD